MTAPTCSQHTAPYIQHFAQPFPLRLVLMNLQSRDFGVQPPREGGVRLRRHFLTKLRPYISDVLRHVGGHVNTRSLQVLGQSLLRHFRFAFFPSLALSLSTHIFLQYFSFLQLIFFAEAVSAKKRISRTKTQWHRCALIVVGAEESSKTEATGPKQPASARDVSV